MISIIMLGSGGATPYKQRTTPMLFVEAQKHTMLFDCGSGATLRLAESNINTNSIESLFFTHFHADHCVDFPVFVLTSYLAGREGALKVYGPQGTKKFVSMMLYELFPYIPKLISNITEKNFSITVEELSKGQVIKFDQVDVLIEEAKHSVPSLCYRINTEIESLTISGDTEFSKELIHLAEGSNVLIHECPFPVHMGSIPDHTSAQDVGIVASNSKVSTVILTHLFEEVVNNEKELIDAVKKNFSGQVILGQDLMKIKIDESKVLIN